MYLKRNCRKKNGETTNRGRWSSRFGRSAGRAAVVATLGKLPGLDEEVRALGTIGDILDGKVRTADLLNAAPDRRMGAGNLKACGWSSFGVSATCTWVLRSGGACDSIRSSTMRWSGGARRFRGDDGVHPDAGAVLRSLSELQMRIPGTQDGARDLLAWRWRR